MSRLQAQGVQVRLGGKAVVAGQFRGEILLRLAGLGGGRRNRGGGGNGGQRTRQGEKNSKKHGHR